VKLRNDDDDFGIGIDRIHGLHSASSSPRGGGVGMHNLELLPHLHEPAILHCLQQRYEEGEIYTYTGPILIAINPFKPMPLMYAPSVLQAFLHQGRLRGAEEGENRPRLPPHVFGIANAAYRNMVAALFNAASSPQSDEDLPLDGRQIWSDMHRNPNQFVLISGESGAGKTESTKFLLRYLTAAGSMGGSDLARDSVMDRIVQSNPVLEAFGNAATLRNHNSSRFGKFIQLHFDGRGRLVSGKVETYLLEKVRLCVHQAGHRNFHVFYQMAAGASPAQRAEWAMLGDIQDFFYATSNNSGGAGVGVKLRLIDDAEEFRLLLHAMAALGIQHTEREELFRATAGILHLGQLAFVPDNDGAADGGGGCGGALNLTAGGREDGSTLRGECIDSIMQASRLLGVHSDELIKCLTTRNILAASESFEKKLTPQQAIDARDALARHLYSRIFSWLVAAINCGISGEAPSKSSSRQHGAVIGVLDIFGFESFHLNSFEQLCINYTNESLQQQFNRHVFKLEEEEYLREGIDPLLVVFSDNQDCLDLIEHRALGILAALDDEGRMPGGSDRNFAARLYKAYGTHARFYATAKHVRSNEFVIKHYAGDVCYNAHLFVDKNRDELPKECSYLLSSASNSLIKAIFSDHCANTKQATNKGGNTTGNKSAVSVGLQFRGQLHDLLAHIAQTVPHYIRCIKPNDSCSGDRFDRIRCVEQLRHCGVLEAVRVARAGFPVRLGHRDFFCRYRPLANPHAPMTAELPRRLYRDESNPKEMCRLLLRAIMDDTFPCVDSSSEERSGDGVHSRLFSYQFWRGTQRIGESAVQLGATKVFLRRLAYDVLEGMVTRRLERAALKVQSVLRATKLRVLYRAMRRSALQIQSVFRGYRSRKHTQQVRCHRAASKIQSSFRRFSALFRYATLRRSALKIQGTVRMFVILRRFRSLRAAIVVLQSACRRRMALYSLKRLHQKAGGEGVLPEDTSENSSTAKISLIRHQVFVEESEGQHAAQLARIAKGLVGVVTGTPTRAASVATASDNAAGVRSSRAAGDDAGIEASFTERLVLVRELAELRARFEEQMSARLIAEQRIASIISEAEVEKTQLLTRIDVLMKHIESLSAALVASRSAFISESPSSALTARIDEERQQRVRLEAQVAALEAAFRDRSSPAASASHHREAFTSSASSSVPAKKSPVRGAAKTVPHPSPSRKVISSANASPSAVSRRHIQQEPVPASPPSSKVEAFVKLLREVSLLLFFL
jgi:myosin-5